MTIVIPELIWTIILKTLQSLIIITSMVGIIGTSMNFPFKKWGAMLGWIIAFIGWAIIFFTIP